MPLPKFELTHRVRLIDGPAKGQVCEVATFCRTIQVIAPGGGLWIYRLARECEGSRWNLFRFYRYFAESPCRQTFRKWEHGPDPSGRFLTNAGVAQAVEV